MCTRALLATLIVLAAAMPATADDCYDPAAKVLLPPDVDAIRSGPPSVLLIDDETLNDWEDVQLKLTLDKTGRTTCAKYEYGQGPLRLPALALARDWRFKPYLANGKPVAVWFSQRVDVRWRNPRPTVRVPFPAIRDWATLRIRLDTSAGYGGCISTEVEIAGDGMLIFDAEYGRVGRLRGTERLALSVVQALVERFRQVDFFWLHNSYTGDTQHWPNLRVSIAFDEHKKLVRDYVGREAGMPAEVAAVEKEIERLADTERRTAGVQCSFGD